jgi:hypothetical protein
MTYVGDCEHLCSCGDCLCLVYEQLNLAFRNLDIELSISNIYWWESENKAKSLQEELSSTSLVLKVPYSSFVNTLSEHESTMPRLQSIHKYRSTPEFPHLTRYPLSFCPFTRSLETAETFHSIRGGWGCRFAKGPWNGSVTNSPQDYCNKFVNKYIESIDFDSIPDRRALVDLLRLRL